MATIEVLNRKGSKEKFVYDITMTAEEFDNLCRQWSMIVENIATERSILEEIQEDYYIKTDSNYGWIVIEEGKGTVIKPTDTVYVKLKSPATIQKQINKLQAQLDTIIEITAAHQPVE